MTTTTPLAVVVPTIPELTDNAARLLQQALAEAAAAADPSALSARDLVLARSNTQALAFVQGAGVHGVYRYLRDFIARQAIPSRSAGDFLDGWLETYGLPRKPAVAATGTVAGTGVNGSVLPAGTLLQTTAGVRVRTVASATVASGAVTAAVVADSAGVAGNLAAGATLQLVASVVGVNTGFTTSAGLSGGVDTESDADAVYRLVQRLANEPMGGCPADYARWALSVAGITRAWGVRGPAGPTSAGVIIMADGNAPYGLPTTGQQMAVRTYIEDPRRGPPDELFVIIPTAQAVSFQLHLGTDTPALRDAMEAELADFFFRESLPGGTLEHNRLIDVLSAVAGDVSYSVVAPAISVGGQFTATTYAHLLVLGTVAWV